MLIGSMQVLQGHCPLVISINSPLLIQDHHRPVGACLCLGGSMRLVLITYSSLLRWASKRATLLLDSKAGRDAGFELSCD